MFRKIYKYSKLCAEHCTKLQVLREMGNALCAEAGALSKVTGVQAIRCSGKWAVCAIMCIVHCGETGRC